MQKMLVFVGEGKEEGLKRTIFEQDQISIHQSLKKLIFKYAAFF